MTSALAVRWGAAATIGAAVSLGVAGVVWAWPVLFLLAVAAIGTVVGQRPWLVMVMVVITCALLSAPDSVVGYAARLWMWTAALVGAAVVVASARRLRPGGPAVLWHLALLLPRGERDHWRSEVHAVLHACATDDTERRRQVRGFLAAVPATVLTSWRTRR